MKLTQREEQLLKVLRQHPEQVLSAQELYRMVWQEEPYGAENVVAVHIYHLRCKMQKDPRCLYDIKTHWRRGYELIKKESL